MMETVRKFILAEFLPGEDPSRLTPTTPLMSSGVLDSIATLKPRIGAAAICCFAAVLTMSVFL